MKKVLFMQNKGNSLGGVWFVNKTIGESLIEKGYSVEVLSIRNNHNDIVLEHDPRLKVSVINPKDEWEIVRFGEIKELFLKGKIWLVVKKCFRKIIDEYKLRCDYNRVRRYIRANNYDYIVLTHYQLLDAIPKEFLYKTVYEHHTSFGISYNHRATRKAFDKYKNKVKFLWLTKSTCDEAIKKGYSNSTYIYNPVRFTCGDRAKVIENKKLITLARISSEKRIDLMIKLVNEIFKEDKYRDWSLEIYGDGDLKEDLMNLDYDKTRIKFMGVTDNSLKVLKKSSINLNTSLFEGFAMGILEANECGVPTVTFRFGESVVEEIIQDKTGIYVEQDDEYAYKKRLKELMSDSKKLDMMSKECKEFSKNFQIDNIILNWIKLFEDLY